MKKTCYQTPQADIFEMRCEAIVCQSAFILSPLYEEQDDTVITDIL